MGGELGNEIYIDLLVSSGLSPPSFILIENNNFYTNLVSKSWCLFLGFRGYLGEIGSGEKKEFFTYVFFSHKQWCVRVSASIFVAQLALVHELRLSEAFYVLWLAQLVLMICTGPNIHANSNEVSLGPAIRATLCYVVKEKQHRRQQQHQQRQCLEQPNDPRLTHLVSAAPRGPRAHSPLWFLGCKWSVWVGSGRL